MVGLDALCGSNFPPRMQGRICGLFRERMCIGRTYATEQKIFGVYKYDEDGKINSGRDTVLAGYCLYGAATQFVVADEENVTMYQLKFTDKKI